MLDLFVSRCQKCSIGKLIFYAGGEYKILHRQFFDGNTLQTSFFNKTMSLGIRYLTPRYFLLNTFFWHAFLSVIFRDDTK